MTNGIRYILNLYAEETIAEMHRHSLYADACLVRKKWYQIKDALCPTFIGRKRWYEIDYVLYPPFNYWKCTCILAMVWIALHI
jgi:hypothetical protein